MKAKNSNTADRTGRTSMPGADPGFETATSGVSRREFMNAGLAGAALLAMTGCATIRGSKNEVEVATTELRNLLDGFEGDGARQARLAAIGHRIKNRCQEAIELKLDFIRRMRDLSQRRETPLAELSALVDDFTIRRVKYREELFGVRVSRRHTALSLNIQTVRFN